MKILYCLIAIAILSAAGTATAGEKADKAKLSALLTRLEAKSQSAEKSEYEVSLPVATAGARAGQARVGNRFAVLWPANNISPLTALVRNLDSDAKHKPLAALRPQVEDFVTTYPEYEGEPLLKELGRLLKSAS